ncbi:MAG: adenylate/guanylate cyclase domain-containing protein [Syntrophales bacterium]|jgi:adenylate cyclase|nr:adenylate/guanylate cyclase domain-containing protein [Syntrophales bacterium]
MSRENKTPKKSRPSTMDEKNLFKKQYLKMRGLYENKIKELSVIRELVDMLRLTGVSDRIALFREQLQVIRKYFFVTHVSLMLFNEKTQRLEMLAFLNDPAHTHPQRDYEFLCHKTAEQAFTQNQSAFMKNAAGPCSPEAEKDGVGQSLLSVPLSHNGQAIGVLNLLFPSITRFDRNQISFFSLVADQIVTSAVLSRLYSQMLREENQRFLLSRFFSKNVAREILKSKGILRLGGDRKRATILFADLRGFTAISERFDEEKVVDVLNDFFSHITPTIFRNEGTLDKLLGDGIMAVFGAPISHAHDPVRAVEAAIEIIEELRLLNGARRDKQWPELKIGIGINTGDVVAGYIGSDDHINYTVIGDAVNVAQRIESMAGDDEILVTRAVKEAIDEAGTDVRGLTAFTALPPLHVKGREKPLTVFRVEYAR